MWPCFRGSAHRLDAWNPCSDRGPVLEEPQVFPTALNGVVDRTKLTSFGIGEASSALEIDVEFK